MPEGGGDSWCPATLELLDVLSPSPGLACPISGLRHSTLRMHRRAVFYGVAVYDVCMCNMGRTLAGVL